MTVWTFNQWVWRIWKGFALEKTGPVFRLPVTSCVETLYHLVKCTVTNRFTLSFCHLLSFSSLSDMCKLLFGPAWSFWTPISIQTAFDSRLSVSLSLRLLVSTQRPLQPRRTTQRPRLRPPPDVRPASVPTAKSDWTASTAPTWLWPGTFLSESL